MNKNAILRKYFLSKLSPISQDNTYIYSLLKLLFDSIFTVHFEKDTLWKFGFALKILFHILVIVIKHNFIVNQVLVVFLLERVDLEVEVECAHKLTSGLVIRKMQLAHIWMSECFINCNSL